MDGCTPRYRATIVDTYEDRAAGVVARSFVRNGLQPSRSLAKLPPTSVIVTCRAGLLPHKHGSGLLSQRYGSDSGPLSAPLA
jgi:hypothetical protein